MRRWSACRPDESADAAGAGATGVVVHVRQVIQDYVQRATRIATSEEAKRGTEFDDTFPLGKAAAQTVGVDIIESEEVFHALRPMIGGADPVAAAGAAPTPRRRWAGLRAAPIHQNRLPPRAADTAGRARGRGFF